MKYKPEESYKSYIDPTMADDPTFINQLAFAAAILDTERRKIEYYLKGLYDKDEAELNIAEIDYINKQGIKTDLQRWYRKSVESTGHKSRPGHNQRLTTPTLIINKYLGEEIRYKTLKEACECNDLNYKSVNNKFWHEKSDEIKYQGLIIRKLV